MNKVIVVVGPTAVGKTKISIELAKKYHCDVISGDSIAVYKRLDIGSAKPTIEEQQNIPHHLIDILEPTMQYNVADFQKQARSIIDKKALSLICGGTGLYIQSVLFNYEFKAEKRDFAFASKYDHYTNEELFHLLISKDKSIDTLKLHPNNRKRVLRALEVYEQMDTSIHSFNKKKEPVYEYFIVYLSMPREKLYQRINERVDIMMREGLEEEVKSLYEEGICPHAIGYQEFIPYFKKEKTKQEVIDEIKKNTRHLAKRQETWFRNQMDSHFYMVENHVDDTIKAIIKDIDRWLKI